MEFIFRPNNASANRFADQVLAIAGTASKTYSDCFCDFVASLRKAIDMCHLSFEKIVMPAASSYSPENMPDSWFVFRNSRNQSEVMEVLEWHFFVLSTRHDMWNS